MNILEFVKTFILPHENAYGKDADGNRIVVAETVPGDNGGTTKYGIDQRSHPGVDVANLTEQQALKIYLDEYNAVTWANLPGMHALDVMPEPADLVFFDCCVLNGRASAWKMAQLALRLVDDGVPGPKTRAAVLAAHDMGPELAAGILHFRRDRFNAIVANNPSQRKFLAGWLNRCDELGSFLSLPEYD